MDSLINSIKRKNIDNLNAINTMLAEIDHNIGILQTKNDWQTISILGGIREGLNKLRYDIEYTIS